MSTIHFRGIVANCCLSSVLQSSDVVVRSLVVPLTASSGGNIVVLLRAKKSTTIKLYKPRRMVYWFRLRVRPTDKTNPPTVSLSAANHTAYDVQWLIWERMRSGYVIVCLTYFHLKILTMYQGGDDDDSPPSSCFLESAITAAVSRMHTYDISFEW